MLQHSSQKYTLVTECPVQWTATQEKSLARDFPVEVRDASSEIHIPRIYQQFLWFPESITPLQYLVPALLHIDSSMAEAVPKGSIDPLRRVLGLLLLTPGSASQKYRDHVPRLLVDEEAVPDLEANMLWYAVKHEKTDMDEEADEQQQELAEEKRQNAWLERVERREILIQIILHFLILTRPEPPLEQRDPTPDPLPPSQSPRKRKRKVPELETMLSNSEIEDRLETLMDKLCMWQLTSALDNITTGNNQKPSTVAQGKQRTVDGRDWMQKFCEDVIEPLFKSVLPDHCALLRSKVFPSSPFSDDSDSDDFLPPPDRGKSKRQKISASTSRRQSPTRQTQRDLATERSLSRSRSLSVSLEQERARSRSVSIGPEKMKRALAREVSMTTVFKAKAQGRAKRQQEEAKTRVARAAKKPNLPLSTRPKKDQGRTLVEATPMKPKEQKTGGKFAQNAGAKLPKLPLDDAEVEELEDWTSLSNSPEIVLLGSNNLDWGDDDGDGGTDPFGTPVRKRKAESSNRQ